MSDIPAASVPLPMNPLPARHPGRWASAVLVTLAVLFILHAFAFSPNIKWNKVGEYLTQEIILRGLGLPSCYPSSRSCSAQFSEPCWR